MLIRSVPDWGYFDTKSDKPADDTADLSAFCSWFLCGVVYQSQSGIVALVRRIIPDGIVGISLRDADFLARSVGTAGLFYRYVLFRHGIFLCGCCSPQI